MRGAGTRGARGIVDGHAPVRFAAAPVLRHPFFIVNTDPGANREKPVHYIYLAGPEVFLPDPVAAGEEKKARITELSRASDWPFELAGLYPLDCKVENAGPDFHTGIRIYRANVEFMDRAYAVAANMVRFRGPSMDVGTAFEMGYMRGLGKPVFAYYEAAPFYGREEAPGRFVDRVRKYYAVSDHDPRVDVDGQSIEDFQMADNLMTIGALESGAGLIAEDFDQVVMQIAGSLLARSGDGPLPRQEEHRLRASRTGGW